MDKLKQISILGCGWLGFPLAVNLIQEGFFVRGSTTSRDKLSTLSAANIEPFLVQFSPELLCDREADFFKTEILFINIPPKGDAERFLKQMEQLLTVILKYAVKHVIFVSSTSVYGEVNSKVDEDTLPTPDSAIGAAILAAENLLFNNPAFKTTVIRFGGLVGPGRHPGRFLSGKSDIPNGRAPVNLIHLDDCIGIIKTVLGKNIWDTKLNACSPDHLSRQEFYKLAAGVHGSPLPHFKDELMQWKLVNSLNVPALLINYQYKVSNWTAWLQSLS